MDPDVAAPTPTEFAPARRRLSPWRVLVALLLLLGAVAGCTYVVRDTVRRSAPGLKGAWFAPYVDATLVPKYPFEDPGDSGSRDVVLGFVVAERDGGCTPTWGTYVDLDGAATSFDLDRRIARLRAAGGEAVVSFGGAVNSELSLRCGTSDELAEAYGKVIDRYDLRVIDLDLEREALSDVDAGARRAAALKQLQDRAEADGRDLQVWLTLPVATTGLTDDGRRVLDQALAAGVRVAGVNVMTMDYGEGRPSDMSMSEAVAASLRATQRQVRDAYRAAGSELTSKRAWAKVGATPMIGQNDTAADRFTLDDAAELVAFARQQGMGRLGMWSANRDGPCGKQMDPKVVSNTCSGEEQSEGQFAEVLNGLDGRPAPVGTRKDAAAVASARSAGARVVDDADTSPYPIWREDRAYVADEKIVWHGNVYEAKWWTRGDLPDRPVDKPWDSPWRYLGPVLPTDRPAPKPNLPTGTYPEWDRETAYTKGRRVLFQGMAYEAKWFTKGDSPQPDRPWETPWQPVTDLSPTEGGSAGDALPEWDGVKVYLTGERVRFQGQAYEATRWNRGDIPGPAGDPSAIPTWRPLSGAATPAVDPTGVAPSTTLPTSTLPTSTLPTSTLPTSTLPTGAVPAPSPPG
ncbi:MAG: chitinase [Microthrixaceae bacterium]